VLGLNTTLQNMVQSYSMKTVFRKVAAFIKNEWFLLVMLATIALIVALFQLF